MTLSGFRAVPLKVGDGATAHTLYIKEHDVRERSESKPSGRTLFVLNVPPFVDGSPLKDALGAVFVELVDRPTAADQQPKGKFFRPRSKVGHKVAYAVYEKESELKKALRIRELKLDRETVLRRNGLSKWIRDYNGSIPDATAMQAEIDQHMAEYDRLSRERAAADKEVGEADDEGWITVTKQGRKPGFERKESVTSKILATKAASQKKKELKNFYTFQIRESKMNHIIALRKKFEEDKKKVQALKQSRRFRPF